VFILSKNSGTTRQVTRPVLDRFHDSSIPPRKCRSLSLDSMLLSKTVNELCSFLALLSEMNIRTCTCIYIFFRDPSKQYSHTMEALNEKVLILKAVYEVIPSDLYPMKKCTICASFFTFKLKILTIFKMFNFYFVDF